MFIILMSLSQVAISFPVHKYGFLKNIARGLTLKDRIIFSKLIDDISINVYNYWNLNAAKPNKYGRVKRPKNSHQHIDQDMFNIINPIVDFKYSKYQSHLHVYLAILKLYVHFFNFDNLELQDVQSKYDTLLIDNDDDDNILNARRLESRKIKLINRYYSTEESKYSSIMNTRDTITKQYFRAFVSLINYIIKKRNLQIKQKQNHAHNTIIKQLRKSLFNTNYQMARNLQLRNFVKNPNGSVKIPLEFKETNVKPQVHRFTSKPMVNKIIDKIIKENSKLGIVSNYIKNQLNLDKVLFNTNIYNLNPFQKSLYNARNTFPKIISYEHQRRLHILKLLYRLQKRIDKNPNDLLLKQVKSLMNKLQTNETKRIREFNQMVKNFNLTSIKQTNSNNHFIKKFKNWAKYDAYFQTSVLNKLNVYANTGTLNTQQLMKRRLNRASF